jgi:hypothetical protein
MNNSSNLWRLVCDRRFWLGPGPLIACLLALANLGASRWQVQLGRERAENLLAIGKVVQPGVVPRFDWSVGESLASYLPFVPDARKTPLVIVAGMSQMYAINEALPGDQIISEHMDDALAPFGIRAFGLAAPNLNNEELLLLLLATLEKPETKPAAMLYGVCFDKFRNVDLRPSLAAFLGGNAALQDSWRSICHGRETRFPAACRKHEPSAEKPKPVEDSRQPDLEGRLRTLAGEASPLVVSRADLNAVVQMQVFLFRNWLLHITPTSKRPVIASRYRLNQELLELFIEVARDHGVTPMLYINPLNPQAENPYVPSEYEAFKVWLTAMAQGRKVPFANLEGAVPLEHWGEFMGGPDFKHFKGEGHRRTATALLEAFAPALRQAASKARQLQ